MVLALTLIGSVVFANEPVAPAPPSPEVEAPVATTEAALQADDGGDHRLIPIFYYTPETRYAGGALLIQNIGPEQEGRTSQITGVATLTANGQYMVNLAPRFFAPEGRGEMSGLVSYRYFPSKYFGRGPDVAIDEKGEDYVERAVDLGFSQALPLNESVNFRWGIQYDRRELLESVNGGLVATEALATGTRIESPGATLGLEWDRRDFPQGPRAGSWHRLQATRLVPQDLDGTARLNPVDRLEADFRWYIPRRQGAVTWAHQLSLTEVTGEIIPFQYLPSVGGGARLRGYYAGRFRDRALALLQGEWRREFRSRWTGTAGVGVGRLAAHAHEWGDARDLWTGAVGVQYLLNRKGRTKIRADLGFGHRPSFYLLLGDAF